MKKTFLAGLGIMTGMLSINAHAGPFSGDFYLSAESGYAREARVKSGAFSGEGIANHYRKSSQGRKVGGRDAIGYLHRLDDNWRLAIESGVADYGSTKLYNAINTNDYIQLGYMGADVMLHLGYELWNEHTFSLAAGAQRTRVALDFRTDDTSSTIYYGHPAYATRAKAGLSYQYRFKSRVALKVEYAHVFGENITRYTKNVGTSNYFNRPNGVPIMNTVMAGLKFFY